jgi:N-acetylneuraminate synthase/N,N'-diacetyllegionaminate synthase
MGILNIAGRAIGADQPCFIVAEAGVNHNGRLDLALQLVEVARQAGADAVKFQTYVTEKLVTPDAIMAEYQATNVGVVQTQFELLKQLELDYSAFHQIQAHARGQGILFLSTADEEDSLDFLDSLDVPAFKIGSAEVTNLPFLRHAGHKGRPILLSTGMSTLGEVDAAVWAIEETGHRELALLHCVSDYPAAPGDTNLRAMDTLRAAFQVPVGLSDHSLGIEIAVAAVARGACIIEKHLTLDRQLPGPDHVMSLEGPEFADLVRAIRHVEAALGSGRKWPTERELATKRVVQKVLVAAHDIPAGKILAPNDLTLRRTSGGLPAAFEEHLIGRRARQAIRALEPIGLSMVE